MDERRIHARNEKKQDLIEFLADYKPGDYERPAVTVDIVILTDRGNVLLIRRRNHPNIGAWALPGGFLDMPESLYGAATRELEEETGVRGAALVSLGLFAEPTRDPRCRVVTAAFGQVVPESGLRFRAGDDAADARLFRYSREALGTVEIPPPSRQNPFALRLPCTAMGQPTGSSGEGVGLVLSGASVQISARLALSGNVPVLLGGTLSEGDEELAGDHALILFTALLALGLS